MTSSREALELPTWRSAAAGPIVAAITLIGALWATHDASVPFRDPDHAVGIRLALVGALVLLLVALDIGIRAARRSGTAIPSRAAMREIRRERWTPRRGVAVAAALVGFYLTYLAYRNLKTLVPVLRPGISYDHALAGIDRDLFAGHNPSDLLHSLLGTGAATQVLALVYVTFIFFLPFSLALALVFSPRLPGGVFYATALSINWGLGAASYFLLPTVGPAFAAHARFAALPHTEVTRLQTMMLDQRRDLIAHPAAAEASQNIAAFASLHVSMIFTAAMTAQLLGVGRSLRIVLWALFGSSILATIFFGWHYVVDDLAGILIGITALALARALTGFAPRTAEHVPVVQPAPAT